VKLYRHGPYMPNGPPGKDGGEMVHPGCDRTPSGALQPIFAMVVQLMLGRTL
jgi:hypothetical protein